MSNLFMTLDYLPLRRDPGYVNHAIFNGTFVSPATLEIEAGLLQIHGFYRLWSEFKANLGELNDTPSEIKK